MPLEDGKYVVRVRARDIDGPDSLHVRAEDLLGHVTGLVLGVNDSAPRTSIHPGLQRTSGQ